MKRWFSGPIAGAPPSLFQTLALPGGLYLGETGPDDVSFSMPMRAILLRGGADSLSTSAPVKWVAAGDGADELSLEAGANWALLGAGDDSLSLGAAARFVDGGSGDDTVTVDGSSAAYDVKLFKHGIVLIDRHSGEETRLARVETVEFDDASLDVTALRKSMILEPDLPLIRVGDGTQVVSVNTPDPTISVIWDQVVQEAVTEETGPNGPTIASRAYAMMHTAMFDAFASFDDTAVRVSLDLEGDNVDASGLGLTEADMVKAMSYAAFTVLMALYPDQDALFEEVMGTRLGYDLTDDGSLAAEIGIDAAEDILGLRVDDGSNQTGDYAGDFTPTNPSPSEINDITAWTPEFVPIDPDDGSDGQAQQSFLTPQWGGVEGFALAELANGETDHADTLPPPPEPFFAPAYEGSVLNFDDQTITLSAPLSLDGTDYLAGDTIAVSKDLIGTVINQGFIDQALVVIDYSANLDDEGKLIAEFWEDGGGTSFPPGNTLTFAQFVSARDDNSVAEDAFLFLAASNAVMDAGIATWHAKVEYDYVRPVRAIRDLGELGLIGEWGTDHLGNDGYVIEAWGGIDPNTGLGLGTKTILATDFVTFQRPGADASPPFAEYTSGHSAFSAAGAEVLALFTGSDDFGGSVTFTPGASQFEPGVPADEVTLEWETFSEAADQSGLSRLYGGIHFEDGDFNGRDLGAQVGADAFALAEMFMNGTATDADRPFADGLLV